MNTKKSIQLYNQHKLQSCLYSWHWTRLKRFKTIQWSSVWLFLWQWMSGFHWYLLDLKSIRIQLHSYLWRLTDLKRSKTIQRCSVPLFQTDFHFLMDILSRWAMWHSLCHKAPWRLFIFSDISYCSRRRMLGTIQWDFRHLQCAI